MGAFEGDLANKQLYFKDPGWVGENRLQRQAASVPWIVSQGIPTQERQGPLFLIDKVI
jgi:hypothetical protein